MISPILAPTRLTFILVDDDPDCSFLTEWSLKKAFDACVVVVCATLGEAVKRLEDVRPDAIVTDYKLSGVELGCDLIQHVRKKGLTCPVVMVTCSEDPNVASNAYSLGVTKVFRAGGDGFVKFLKTLFPDTPKPM